MAGKKAAAGQPRVETAIVAATAAPEFREHLWETGGVGDIVGDMGGGGGGGGVDGDGDGDDARARAHERGVNKSRGRTPTGGFADDRRAPPRGLGLPSNVFSPLKLQT